MIDTGSHFLSGGLFGKLTIQAGTKPTGVNGGMTCGNRIGRDIVIEQSNAMITNNQPSSSNCNVTFAAGTSNCYWIGNQDPASLTNNGNANNHIQREASGGSNALLSFGDDSWTADFKIESWGQFEFPDNVIIPGGHKIFFKDSSGSDKPGIALSNGDDWTFGSNNGAGNWTLLSGGDGGIYIGPSGASAYQASSDRFRPVADGGPYLGDASHRWNTIYSTTGTINTSDEREKQDIREISMAERHVAKALKSQMRAFRWRDAVAEKGDGARIHFGVIAQQVAAAFADQGLDAHAYGILCHDAWEAQEQITGENGEVLTPARKAGERFGVRYEELFAFVIAAS